MEKKHTAIQKSKPKFSDKHQYYEKYTKILRNPPKLRALEMKEYCCQLAIDKLARLTVIWIFENRGLAMLST